MKKPKNILFKICKPNIYYLDQWPVWTADMDFIAGKVLSLDMESIGYCRTNKRYFMNINRFLEEGDNLPQWTLALWWMRQASRSDYFLGVLKPRGKFTTACVRSMLKKARVKYAYVPVIPRKKSLPIEKRGKRLCIIGKRTMWSRFEKRAIIYEVGGRKRRTEEKRKREREEHLAELRRLKRLKYY